MSTFSRTAKHEKSTQNGYFWKDIAVCFTYWNDLRNHVRRSATFKNHLYSKWRLVSNKWFLADDLLLVYMLVQICRTFTPNHHFESKWLLKVALVQKLFFRALPKDNIPSLIAVFLYARYLLELLLKKFIILFQKVFNFISIWATNILLITANNI